MARTYKKRKHILLWQILGSIAALFLIALLVVHTYLASWLLDYVNNVLANIRGYAGSAEQIHIDLYRGAYRIDKLVINKKEGKIPTPFVAIDVVDFSVEWSALLHGRFVSSARLTHPVVNFAVNNAAKQTGAEVDWTKPIKDLMPIDIDYVLLKDGSVTYQDFSSMPQVNIFIHHLNGEVHNLRNVEDASHPLPSTLHIRGGSIGNGDMDIQGRMNILKPTPDMDLLLALKNVDLPALNNYSEAYAAFDFESGNFNFYSHLIVKDNQVSGYVKPMAQHLSVDMLKTANPLQVVWNAALATVLEVLTNHSKDQFATKAELEGDLGNIGTNTWSTLAGILRNAFIQALSEGFDKTGNDELTKPLEER